MRIPLGWLAEYVDVDDSATPEQIAAALVSVGLEEEGLFSADITGPIVVGKVLEFESETHKNGKTVRWCTLDVGRGADDPQQVICGASNFAVNDLVVVAMPGAVLPGGFSIGKRKTYGHMSAGMICSAKELGLGDDHDGIIILADRGLDATPGDDALNLLGLTGPDNVGVEVNVTPDRGYCFSIRGVAREYAHATNQPVAERFRDPAALDTPGATRNAFTVRLVDDAPIHDVPGCARFATRIVTGLNGSAQAPSWMQKRLQMAGMRSISLIVDITNYVMLSLGQPLHAYDISTLHEPITVRRAHKGEKLTTLDGAQRVLHPEDLLICDGKNGDRAIGMAGVMGGADTEVTDSTTDVLIEAAWFDPITIARSARRHKLPSEASKRFERGVDPNIQAAAAQLAVDLLVEYGGGTASDRVGLVGEPPSARTITLHRDRATSIVGVNYDVDRQVHILTEIGCDVSVDGDQLQVVPPSWRPDLDLVETLVEEIARIDGYDKIPSVVPAATPGGGLPFTLRVRRAVAGGLTARGLDEVMTYPFTNSARLEQLGMSPDDERVTGAVTLSNPLNDEQPLLRTTILDTLVDAVRRNVSRGADSSSVFEIGRIASGRDAVAPLLGVDDRPTDEQLQQLESAIPDQPVHVAGVLSGHRDDAGFWGAGRHVEAADAVEIVAGLCADLGIDVRFVASEQMPWHPGRCVAVASSEDNVVIGYAGEIHPKVCESLELPSRTVAFELNVDAMTGHSGAIGRAASLSVMPVSKEDIALIVDSSVSVGELQQVIAQGAGPLLESIRLFDIYTGDQIEEGKRSLAFALRFRALNETLTQEVTAQARQAAVQAAVDAFGAVQRTS